MKRFLLLILLFPLCIHAQFYLKKDHLVYGINVGAYIANSNTAHIYRGDATAYNVYSIFNNPNYTATFDQYFQYPYSIVDLPRNMVYKPGLEIGIHLGKQLEHVKYYMDLNFADLSLVDFITVAIEDPNNQSTEPNYQAININGKEKRNFLNLGIVANFIDKEDFHVGLPVFAQFNQTRLENNYIVVNNQTYNINHAPTNSPQRNPGGFSFGGGSGLIFTFDLNEKIDVSFGYHLQFANTNMSDQLSPWGLHHSTFARMVWMKE